jgi:hypothetical protein
MVKYNIRVYAYAIIGLALITYGVIFFLTQDLSSIDFVKALSHVSTTVAFNILLWLVFIKWIWKCKWLCPWFVPFPNLSGRWEGVIKSEWEGVKLAPIPTEVTIHQTFFKIQVSLKTAESTSRSIAAMFNIDQETGHQQLIYSYMNAPKPGVRDRSQIHYGSVKLDFEGTTVEEMEGEYWTSRKTIGEIVLKRAKGEKHVSDD